MYEIFANPKIQHFYLCLLLKKYWGCLLKSVEVDIFFYLMHRSRLTFSFVSVCVLGFVIVVVFI